MIGNAIAMLNILASVHSLQCLCVYVAILVPSCQRLSASQNKFHRAVDLRVPTKMWFLAPLSIILSLAAASIPAFSLYSRQSVICQVLPIAADAFNGNIPCGGGSVISACTCCPDGMTTCSTALQTCQIGAGGGYVCQDNSVLSGASTCSAQGLIPCGNGCMPSGQTCCGPMFCKGTEYCCSLTDGTPACCTPDASGSQAATSTATNLAYSPMPDPATTSGPEVVQSDSPSTGTSSTSAQASAATPGSTSSTSSNASNAPMPSNPGSRLALSYIVYASGIVLAVVFG
jgi:hypothetical protein